MDILNFLGRLHLLLLHLPLGILALAVWLEIGSRWAKQPDFQPLAKIALRWGAISAIAAAACGWLLAGRGLYDPGTLFWHKWLGFATAGFAVFAWLWQGSRWYFPALLACAAALTGAGHFGGTLTHGAGYLTEPLAGPSILAAAATTQIRPPKPETPVFRDIIQPILTKKCGSCHGPAKAKGGLRLDSPEAIQQGGESGKPLLTAGRPDASELLHRAALPMSDEHHMPPSGKPQLTDDELTLLRWWIAQGADFQRRFSEMKLSPEVGAVFENSRNTASASPVFSKKVPLVSPGKIAALRSAGIAVLPLGENAPWLSVSLAGQKEVSAEKLALLKTVREQVVHLDFGNSALDGPGLKMVCELPNLLRLNLSGTRLSDADLAPVAKLEFLENLNLTGLAGITDAGAAAFSKLKNLKNLHLWKTGISPAMADKLRAQIAGLQVNSGPKEDTSAAPLALRSPKILSARSIFNDTVQVTLDFPFSGVSIHYDFDQASPTTESPRWQGTPLVFEKTTRLRAFAAKKGWANSPMTEALFVKRKFSPRKVTLLGPPSKKYPGKGAATLHDGILSELRSDEKFLGYQGEHLTAVLEFAEVIDFQRINVHCFEENGAWIFAPAGLKIWTSDDGRRWKPCIAARYPPPPVMQPSGAKIVSEAVAGGPQRARFLKITVENLLKNPKWHAAPGSPCWVFVDEVLVE